MIKVSYSTALLGVGSLNPGLTWPVIRVIILGILPFTALVRVPCRQNSNNGTSTIELVKGFL